MRFLKGKFLKPKRIIVNLVESWIDAIFNSLFFILTSNLIISLPIENCISPSWLYVDRAINQNVKRLQLWKRTRQNNLSPPKKLKIWWSRSHNFGDGLTPYLLSGIANVDCVWDHQKKAIGVGSVIRFAHDETIIWGSGIIRSTEIIPNKPICLSVRGPLTREKVITAGGTCPEIYGDPGMLLPYIYTPKKLPHFQEVSIAPHYKHDFLRQRVTSLNYIDVLTRNLIEMENLIDQIANSRVVITSALHIFITCVAYGIPVTVFKYQTRSIGGDNVKFKDFCLGVNMDPIEIVQLSSFEEADVNALVNSAKVYPHSWDPKPMLRSLNSYVQSDYLSDFMSRI